MKVGEPIAAAAGGVLLIALFLPWYDVKIAVTDVLLIDSVSAWQVLSVIDVLLAGVALVALCVPAARAAGSLPPDLPVSRLLLAAGGLGLLLVLFRMVDLPVADVSVVAAGDSIELDRKIGVFIALFATACIAYGGWRARGERPAGGT